MVYPLPVFFIESPIVTADVKALQEHLAYRPDASVLITQTGGLRRMNAEW